MDHREPGDPPSLLKTSDVLLFYFRAAGAAGVR
jgi:hypothetical protein